MKKFTMIVSFLLCICLVFGLAACGHENELNVSENANESSQLEHDHSHEESSNQTNESTSTEESTSVDNSTSTDNDEEIDLENHTHEYKVEITNKATCIESGKQTYTCKCGDSYEEEIPALGHEYTTNTVKPTEIEKGYDEHICTRCNDNYKDNYVNSLNGNKTENGHTHKYTAKVTKEADCLVHGEKTYTCSCGDSYTERIPATGHEYKAEKTNATCLDKGYTTNTCKNCGYLYPSNYTNALGHNFGSWTKLNDNEHQAKCSRCNETKTETHTTTSKVTKEATCTSNGEKTYTCECGYSFTETIQALGHDYKAKTVKPTETEKGYDEHTCSRCNDSYKDNYTLATGLEDTSTETSTPHTHNYTSKVTKEATCTEKGTKTFTCSCGDTYTETIPATGHSYSDNVVKPTCTEKGYTTHKCSKCGNSYDDTFVDATGHSYDNGKVTTAATCTKTGVKTYTCTKCKATRTETIAATGHQHTEVRNKKDATCAAEGYTGDTYCKDCNTKLSSGTNTPKLAHSYNNGEVTKAATCTADGVKTYTCTKCGDKKTETISKTGHNYTTTKTNPTCTEKGYTTHTCSKCGDTYKDSYVDATSHKNTEVRNKKDATCTTTGYTGDTYCKDCNTKLNTGTTIPKTDHKYDNGKVTKAATCTATGVKTFTCTVCGNTKTETIQALGHDYIVTTEQTPVYEWFDTVILWVTYNTYEDGRRIDHAYDIEKVWTVICDEDFDENYLKAYAEYNALLKEIQTNGWAKVGAGFGYSGDPVQKLVGYKTTTTYTCKRCGHTETTTNTTPVNTISYGYNLNAMNIEKKYIELSLI